MGGFFRRDCIEGVEELVVGEFANVGCAGGRGVIEDMVCAERLDKIEIMFGASCDDFEARAARP